MISYLEELCEPTEFFDHTSRTVREFVRRVVPDPRTGTDVERARALYYAVRDGIQYEVYGADLSRRGLRASSIIQRGMGLCVHKAIVYAAATRAAGVPSRLLYADVRNHLASDRLIGLMGGDVFRFHGLNSVFVGGRWVKATPAFSRLMCRLNGIRPVEFDGPSDGVHYLYDRYGRRHLEILQWHGEFDDFPYELVVNGIRSAHPGLFQADAAVVGGSLLAEAGRNAS